MAFIALEKLYPIYAADIAQFRSEGIPDSSILESIQDNIRQLREEGLSPEAAGAFVSRAADPQIRPGLGERFFKSAAREASFGLFQPELPEPVGVGEGLADIAGIVPGFVVPAKAAQAIAARFLPRIMAKAGLRAVLSPGAQQVIKGATEGAVFTGLSTAGTSIARRELPDVESTLESLAINSALFGVGELVPLLRKAREISKGTVGQIPLAEIERQLLTRSPGKIDFGNPDFTRLALESAGFLPPQGSIDNPVPVRTLDAPLTEGEIGRAVEQSPILPESVRTTEPFVPIEQLKAQVDRAFIPEPETGFMRRPAPPEAQRVLPERAGGAIEARPSPFGAERPRLTGAVPRRALAERAGGPIEVGPSRIPKEKVDFITDVEGQLEMNAGLDTPAIDAIKKDVRTVTQTDAGANAKLAKAVQKAKANVKQDGLFDKKTVKRVKRADRGKPAGRKNLLKERAEDLRLKGRIKTPKKEVADAAAAEFNEVATEAAVNGNADFLRIADRPLDVTEVATAKGPKRPVGESTFVDPTEVVQRPDSIRRLRQVAEEHGFRVEFERGPKGVQSFLRGKSGRKTINQPFNDAESVIREVFTGGDIFGEPLKQTKTEVTNKIMEYRASRDRGEPATETFRGKRKLKCKRASPVGCVPDPEDLRINTAAREIELLQLLKPTEAGVQAAAAVKKSVPFIESVKNLKQVFSEKPLLTTMLSPSFHLEKFPLGKRLIQAVDRQSLLKDRYMTDSIDRVFGKKTSEIGKRRGGLTDLEIKEGTVASIGTGYIIENPDVAGRYPKSIQRAAKVLSDEFEILIREAHAIDPNIKVGRIKNYLTHIFDPELVKSELIQEINALKGESGATSLERASHLQENLDLLNRGQAILYEGLPTSLRSRFFETRTGKGGYSFDAAKAYMTYLGNTSRKLYFDKVMNEFVPRLGELPEGVQGLAREYIRDVAGIKDRIPDQIAHIAANVREAQFVRTIGFNPLTAAKNAFQPLFTTSEIGVGHTVRGWQLYRHGLGKGIFDASGHGLDVPDMFIRRESHTAYTSGWKRMVAVAGWMFHKVETTNRGVSYLGGLSKWYEANAKKAGVSLEEAMSKGFDFIPLEAKDFANDIVRKTQFRYGKVDLPLLLRDPLIGTALQFSSFPIKASELMWKWGFREGRAGRRKLLTFLTASGGVATFGALAGFPTLGDGVASPINVVEMFDVLAGASEGDWVRAKAALKNSIDARDFGVRFGPTARLVFEAGELGNKFFESQRTDEAIKQFGARNLLPVPLRRFGQAWSEWQAGGNAGDFVASFAGLPTADAIARREVIRLLKKGQFNSANDFITAYRKANGGVLPTRFMDPTVKRELIRQASLKTKEQRVRIKKETPRQAQIRRLRGPTERIIRNPLFNKTGVF